MILLDSNIIISLSKKQINPNEIFNKKKLYAVSVITYMEVLGFNFQNREEKNFIESIFNSLKILYVDELIARRVIKIREIDKIKLPDAIIAATALEHKAVLYTNDQDFIKLPTLKLEHFLSQQ